MLIMLQNYLSCFSNVSGNQAEDQKGKQNIFLPPPQIPLKDSQVFITVISAGELEGANFKTKIKRETLTIGRLAEQKVEGEDFFMASLPVS